MMSSAGHLPPITVDPGGPARPLRLLAEALEPASADAMCASAMARMLAERVASDDIALLAVRYTAAP